MNCVRPDTFTVRGQSFAVSSRELPHAAFGSQSSNYVGKWGRRKWGTACI